LTKIQDMLSREQIMWTKEITDHIAVMVKRIVSMPMILKMLFKFFF
jgi:hypothetical protein